MLLLDAIENVKDINESNEDELYSMEFVAYDQPNHMFIVKFHRYEVLGVLDSKVHTVALTEIDLYKINQHHGICRVFEFIDNMSNGLRPVVIQVCQLPLSSKETWTVYFNGMIDIGDYLDRNYIASYAHSNPEYIKLFWVPKDVKDDCAKLYEYLGGKEKIVRDLLTENGYNIPDCIKII